MTRFRDLTEDQQSVFLTALLRKLSDRAFADGFQAHDLKVLDASLLVDIQRAQSWIVRHLDQILRSDSQRYRDDEFERALREYADKVGLSDALDQGLVSASQWRW